MATWSSRGLRGSSLEDLINISIDKLREDKLAVIQKIPTPITPIEIDKGTRHITLAYFDQKSTIDYMGVVQGIPVCFDAKECAADTFPLQNVHEHQMSFMEDFERQEGIAFYLIAFTGRHEYYYMPFREMKVFWDRMQKGGRKSIRYEELQDSHFLQTGNKMTLPILVGIQKDLNERNQNCSD